MNYKVGDKVRVRQWNEMEKEFGLDSDGDIKCESCFTRAMKKFCGKIFTVEEVLSSYYELKGGESFSFSDDMLETVCNKKIVITSDGKTTLARLFENGKVTKTAKAKCSPDDEFDFQTGAKTAFDRLFKAKPVEGEMYRVVGNTNNLHRFPIGEKVKCIRVYKDENSYFRSEKTGMCQYVSDCDVEPIVEPKYYSGKVVCVDKHKNAAYTVGKIYEFKNGRVEIDSGEKIPTFPVISLDEWNNSDWALAKFIELKE